VTRELMHTDRVPRTISFEALRSDVRNSTVYIYIFITNREGKLQTISPEQKETLCATR